MLSPSEYSPIVTRAILVMDEFDPGWWKTINVLTLDLASCEDCLLGQRFGSFGPGTHVLQRRGANLSVDPSDTTSVRRAFFPFSNSSREPHVESWRSEVIRRQQQEQEALQYECSAVPV